MKMKAEKANFSRAMAQFAAEIALIISGGPFQLRYSEVP